MLPYANKVKQRLKTNGDTIHFITARLMNIDGCNTESITRKSLADFDIPYDDNTTMNKKLYITYKLEKSYLKILNEVKKSKNGT